MPALDLRGGLLAALLAVAAVVLVAPGAALSPATMVIGGGQGDFASIAWGLWEVARAFPAWPGVRFPDVMFPVGADLMLADLPESYLVAPVTLLFGPVVAYNLLQLLHPALASFTAFLLARDEGVERPAALVSGLAFGFCGVMLSSVHNGNPDVSPLYLIPLGALFSRRCAQSGLWAIAAGVLLGLSPWCNPYVAVMTGLAMLLYAPRPRSGVELMRMIGAAALAAGLAFLFVHLVEDTINGPAAMVRKRTPRPIHAGSAWLRGFLLPEWDHTPDAWTVHSFYVGLSVWLMAGFGLWRARSAGARAAILVGLGLILGLGRTFRWGVGDFTIGAYSLYLPAEWFDHIQGLDALGIRYRFGALAALGASLLAGRALAGLAGPGRTGLIIVVVLADLLIAGGGARLLQAGPRKDDGSCEVLAPLESGAVMDLPALVDEQWMLMQTCHGRPIGQAINRGYPGGVAQVLARPAMRSLQGLKAEGFRYVVLHGSHSEEAEELDRIARLTEAAQEVGAIVATGGDRVVVIDLSRLPPDVRP
jgi:hypothetical protein